VERRKGGRENRRGRIDALEKQIDTRVRMGRDDVLFISYTRY
jgi:hypothetical protein